MTELSSGTLYFYRAFVLNVFTPYYGEVKSFTTASSAQSDVTTGELTSISYTAAEANFSIDNQSSYTSFGLCWSTDPNPTTDDAHTTDSGGYRSSFSHEMTNLSAGTLYYFRAYADNMGEVVYGTVSSFTTLNYTLPEATTEVASSITQYTADSGGIIHSSGNDPTITGGICWSTEPNPTIYDSYTTDINQQGSFDSEINGLDYSTTYYYRAYATNSVGTSYGAQHSFTTLDLTLPVLNTTEISERTQISASSGGNIISDGGLPILSCGVCWSTEANPDINDNLTNDFLNDDSFTSELTGLSEGSTYYCRAYATNSLGTSYGEEYTVKTLFYPDNSAGKCFRFSGDYYNPKYISLTDTAGVMDFTDDFTIEAWVYPFSLGGRSRVFSNRIAHDYGTFQFEVGSSGGYEDRVAVYVFHSTGGHSLEISSENNTISADEWTHIACTYSDSENEIKLYINGIEAASEFCGYNFINPDNFWSIGDATPGFYNFDGRIDEVRLWNVARTEQQIATNINCALRGTENGLVSYWQFNEESGTIALDNQNNIHGDLIKINFWYDSNIPFGRLGVDTVPATSITTASAESGGEIYHLELTNCQACGVCWSTEPNPTVEDNHTSDSHSSGSVDSILNGLTDSTTYYYRAYATNVFGTSYGEEHSFTTLPPSPPVVATVSATSIEHTSAEAGGKIVDYGASPFLYSGLCRSTEPNPTIEDSIIIDSTNVENFSYTMSGLSSSTFYYFKAFAANELGIGYGEVDTLTTLSYPIPQVETEEITSIVDNYAVTGGNITSGGDDPNLVAGVCWSTEPNPTISDNHTNDSVEDGSFSSSIGVLTPATKYYYRAYATSESGTAYGEECSIMLMSNGSGTEVDPYQISNLEELRSLSENSVFWNLYYIQTNDIDASDTQYWNEGQGFTPIFDTVDDDILIGFSGVYDGADYTINNLYINNPTVYIASMFGYCNNAALRNIKLTNIDFSGGELVAGLGGIVDSTNVTNSFVSGNIATINTETSHLTAGFILNTNYSTISDCGASVTINQSNITFTDDYTLCSGGFIAQAIESTVENCFSSGSVTFENCGEIGQYSYGGFVGLMLNMQISNCYSITDLSLNSINVTGMSFAGGFCSVDQGNNSSIENCYSAGTVSAVDTNIQVSGFITVFNGTEQNCFWDDDVYDFAASAAGTAQTTAQMKTQSTFTDAGWDFDNIWSINSTDNDGYPFLQWQEFSQSSEIDAVTDIIISITDNTAVLSWLEVSGGYWYKIYGSDNPDFDCNEETYLGITQETTFSIDISALDKGFFKIVVSDQKPINENLLNNSRQ